MEEEVVVMEGEEEKVAIEGEGEEEEERRRHVIIHDRQTDQCRLFRPGV